MPKFWNPETTGDLVYSFEYIDTILSTEEPTPMKPILIPLEAKNIPLATDVIKFSVCDPACGVDQPDSRGATITVTNESDFLSIAIQPFGQTSITVEPQED